MNIVRVQTSIEMHKCSQRLKYEKKIDEKEYQRKKWILHYNYITRLLVIILLRPTFHKAGCLLLAFAFGLVKQ